MEDSKIALYIAIIGIIVAGASMYQSFTAVNPLTNEIKSLKTSVDSLTERIQLIESTIGLEELVEQKQLVEAAKAEGKLVAYVALDPYYREPLAEAFNLKYPSIEIEFWEGDSSEILDKFRAEIASGQRLGDLMISTDTATMELHREAGDLAFEKMNLPEGTLDGYQEAMIDSVYPDNPEIVTVRVHGPSIPYYNTELVAPEDVPQSYEDFLDPKWSGQQICIEDRIRRGGGGTNTWMIAMLEKGVLTEEYFRELAEQEPVFVRGHTGAARQLAAGEFPLYINYFAYKLEQFQEMGAPINYIMLEGVPKFTSSNSIAIIKDAPHANAARLFVRWVLSTEGQKAVRDAGMVPARFDISPLNRELGGEDLFVFEKEWASKREEYTELMAEIFGS